MDEMDRYDEMDEMSDDDLMDEDDSNIKEIGRVTYGDWDALRKIISDKDKGAPNFLEVKSPFD